MPFACKQTHPVHARKGCTWIVLPRYSKDSAMHIQLFNTERETALSHCLQALSHAGQAELAQARALEGFADH